MTLRARLAWMLLLTLAPLGLGVGVGLYAFVRTSLTARLDDALVARVEALAAVVRDHAERVELDFEDRAMPQYARAGAGADPAGIAYFELWVLDDAGEATLLERSESLATTPLLRPDMDPIGRPWNAELPGDVDIRVLVRRAVALPPDDDDAASGVAPPRGHRTRVLIGVGISREPLDEPLEAMVVGLLAAGLLLLGAGALSIRWALARALGPVRTLAAQVEAIDASTLGSRLDAAHLPPEIAPIQQRINALLERIEHAMERERRFAGAAAHELRTPVAELRTLLEVASSRPRSEADSAKIMRTALASVERLESLVTSLLRLTRIESGREPASLEQTHLAGLVRKAITEPASSGQPRRVAFRIADDEGPGVLVDRRLLSLALSNLLLNAAEYADAGSDVLVEIEHSPGTPVIRITNDASTMTGQDPARAGEPLWRADAARSDGAHLGLGLALARAAIEATGGDLSLGVEGASPPRFVATLRLGRCILAP